MTPQEFENLVANDPALAGPLRKAGQEVTPRLRGAFGTAVELAALAALFPIVKFVINHIGLPWLHEAKRYSELWRQKFHKWVDEQYRQHGLDPDQVEAAGETLRRELEAISEQGARSSWERLAGLLKGGEGK